MGSIPCELEAHHRLDFICKTQLVNVGSPIIDSIVFSGGSKFDVFCGEIDDAIVGAAAIVSALGRMIVEISADPMIIYFFSIFIVGVIF